MTNPHWKTCENCDGDGFDRLTVTGAPYRSACVSCAGLGRLPAGTRDSSPPAIERGSRVWVHPENGMIYDAIATRRHHHAIALMNGWTGDVIEIAPLAYDPLMVGGSGAHRSMQRAIVGGERCENAPGDDLAARVLDNFQNLGISQKKTHIRIRRAMLRTEIRRYVLAAVNEDEQQMTEFLAAFNRELLPENMGVVSVKHVAGVAEMGEPASRVDFEVESLSEIGAMSIGKRFVIRWVGGIAGTDIVIDQRVHTTAPKPNVLEGAFTLLREAVERVAASGGALASWTRDQETGAVRIHVRSPCFRCGEVKLQPAEERNAPLCPRHAAEQRVTPRFPKTQG